MVEQGEVLLGLTLYLENLSREFAPERGVDLDFESVRDCDVEIRRVRLRAFEARAVRRKEVILDSGML